MEKQKLNSQSFFKQSNTAPFRLNSVKIVRKNHISSFSKNPTFDERENISQKTFNFKDITFTSEFNSGNMKQCTKIKENQFSILIASDCEGKYILNKISIFKIWFYFGVISEKERNIKISIDNLNNFYKIFKNGYKICYNILDENETPASYQNKYKENEEANWKRLDTDYELNLDIESNLLSIKFKKICFIFFLFSLVL